MSKEKIPTEKKSTFDPWFSIRNGFTNLNNKNPPFMLLLDSCDVNSKLANAKF